MSEVHGLGHLGGSDTTAQVTHLEGMKLFIGSLALSICVFLQVLDFSIANVSIPYIAGGLAVSQTEGTWVITMFAVGNAIALPVTGWVTARFGAIRVMVSSILLFVLTSFLCGLSFSLEMLVLCRFLQGLVAGPLIPLSQSLMLMSYPPEKKNFALAIWTMVALVGPIAGPILGGWITYDYSWPWIFYINVPIGLLSAVLIWNSYQHMNTIPKKISLDWIGLLFLAIGVSSLQILLDKGEQYDWFRSDLIRLLTVTSVLFLILTWIWESTDEDPLIDLGLFRKDNFALGTALTSLSYMFIFGAIVISPLWLQDFMGYTALWAGLAVAPMGVVPLFGAALVAKLMDRYGYRLPLISSFLVFSFSFFIFSRFTTAISFPYIALSRLLFGVGLAAWLSPLMALSLFKIPQDKLPMATGIFHFFRIFMGGVGTSLSVVLWNRRGTHHHSNLVDTINPFDPNSQGLFALLEDRGIVGEPANTIVNQMAYTQAYMLSTNDLFWLSMGVFLIFALLSCLFKPVPRV